MREQKELDFHSGETPLVPDYIEEIYRIRRLGNRIEVRLTKNRWPPTFYVSLYEYKADTDGGKYVYIKGSVHTFSMESAARDCIAELYKEVCK